MRKHTPKKTRKGFTLIEIIFAIVVVAVLAALTIPRYIAEQRNAQISSVVQSDLKTINDAAITWREQSSDSDKTFSNINTSALCSYLPSSMACDGTWIYSSGYKGSGGKGLIKYKILSDKLNNDGDSYKIFMDATDLANAQKWGDRPKLKIEQTFMDIAVNISNDKENTKTGKDNTASDIGDPNAAFTDGGAVSDAMAGVRYIIE
jgi:prepilin-type N-terminal cleavage/methylation domain-containing protein